MTGMTENHEGIFISPVLKIIKTWWPTGCAFSQNCENILYSWKASWGSIFRQSWVYLAKYLMIRLTPTWNKCLYHGHWTSQISYHVFLCPKSIKNQEEIVTKKSHFHPKLRRYFVFERVSSSSVLGGPLVCLAKLFTVPLTPRWTKILYLKIEQLGAAHKRHFVLWLFVRINSMELVWVLVAHPSHCLSTPLLSTYYFGYRPQWVFLAGGEERPAFQSAAFFRLKTAHAVSSQSFRRQPWDMSNSSRVASASKSPTWI